MRMNISSMLNTINNYNKQTESLTASTEKLPFGLTKPFPGHWGNPPEIQTQDWVELPASFGNGSSTLKNWIIENLARDAAEFEKSILAE